MYITNGTGSTTMTMGTPVFAGTNSTNYTLTFTWTGGNAWHPMGAVPKVKDGKYRVRCRGCARWAKVISQRQVVGGPTRWRVNCERCMGENDGFV